MSDFKSQLNQYCQKCRFPIPKYSSKTVSNLLSPSPKFTSSVELLDGQVSQVFESEGTFGNKKSAEQSAAEVALKHIKQSLASPAKTTTTTSSLTKTSSQSQNERLDLIRYERDGIDGPISMSPDSSTVPSTIASEKEKNIVSSNPLTSKIPPLASSKSLLNERAQKLHLAPPSYNSFIENGSYCSIVTFNNESYRSKGFYSQKKEAEKSAAQVALLALDGHSETLQKSAVEPGSSVSQVETDSTLTSLNASYTLEEGCGLLSRSQTSTPQFISFKNVLQEYMQQRRIGEKPKYSTMSLENGLFKSTVACFGKTAESSQGFSTKKEAEQSAARAALVSLGIEDPESIALHSKGKGRMVAIDLNWNGPQRKRPRLDDINISPKRLKLESEEVIKEAGFINSLTVGEIWKEKGNVALVGNAETSFVLYCTRASNSVQILNTRTLINHTLQPGDRIIGLDGNIVNSQGKLVLQAERCADIEMPDKPDPVLISCGVVTLHKQDSSHTEVLLKRYQVSQAFVNVKAALAQFFRRALSGNPVSIPINDLTEHIETWKLDEVVAIATMTAASIQHLFSSQWKFKEQWSKVLQHPLPRDLKELQKKAEQELSHRNTTGINVTDIENHPWSLPKGNFRHRLLKTGLHFERPAECAARELSEETGIQLFSADLESVPYIDVPQIDNLNPHKGDVSRYFLYVYKAGKPGMNPCHVEDQTFTSPEKLEISAESVDIDIYGQPSSTMECGDTAEEKQQHPLSSQDMGDKKKLEVVEMQPVSLSQLLGENSTSESQSESAKPSSKMFKEPQLFVLDGLSNSESTSSSSSPSPRQKTSPLNSELPSFEEQKINVDNDDVESNSNKVCGDESNSAKEDKTYFQNEDAGLCSRGKKRKRSVSDDGEEYNPDQPTTPSSDVVSFSSYQSPSVKGGNHEECAWFPVEEAVTISPLFARIYENQKFIDLLESLKDPSHSDLKV